MGVSRHLAVEKRVQSFSWTNAANEKTGQIVSNNRHKQLIMVIRAEVCSFMSFRVSGANKMILRNLL